MPKYRYYDNDAYFLETEVEVTDFIKDLKRKDKDFSGRDVNGYKILTNTWYFVTEAEDYDNILECWVRYFEVHSVNDVRKDLVERLAYIDKFMEEVNENNKNPKDK